MDFRSIPGIGIVPELDKAFEWKNTLLLPFPLAEDPLDMSDYLVMVDVGTIWSEIASAIVACALLDKRSRGRNTLMHVPIEAPDDMINEMISRGAIVVADFRPIYSTQTHHLEETPLYPSESFSIDAFMDPAIGLTREEGPRWDVDIDEAWLSAAGMARTYEELPHLVSWIAVSFRNAIPFESAFVRKALSSPDDIRMFFEAVSFGCLDGDAIDAACAAVAGKGSREYFLGLAIDQLGKVVLGFDDARCQEKALVSALEVLVDCWRGASIMGGVLDRHGASMMFRPDFTAGQVPMPDGKWKESLERLVGQGRKAGVDLVLKSVFSDGVPLAHAVDLDAVNEVAR